jgi:hypothetical protein
LIKLGHVINMSEIPCFHEPYQVVQNFV